MITILGADGSGKSSVIDQLRVVLEESDSSLAAVFSGSRVCHMRPRVFKPQLQAEGLDSSDPHQLPPRTPWVSVSKLLYFLMDYWAAWLWLFPKWQREVSEMSQGKPLLIIFDRYFHDILVDPYRYRYGAPLSLAYDIARWIPKPRHLFVLDAPVEVLQARKQEVPFEECERQRQAYLRVCRLFPHATVLDATQPVEASVAHIVRTLGGAACNAASDRADDELQPEQSGQQPEPNQESLVTSVPAMPRSTQTKGDGGGGDA